MFYTNVIILKILCNDLRISLFEFIRKKVFK